MASKALFTLREWLYLEGSTMSLGILLGGKKDFQDQGEVTLCGG